MPTDRFVKTFLTALLVILLTPASAVAESWIVAYFETLPGSVEEGRDAARSYVNSIRAEEGNAVAFALQQQGRNNQFVIVEAWESDAAREMHASSPLMGALRNSLEPLLISGYDERIYLGSVPAGELPVGPETVYVVTHIDIGSRPRETGINLVEEMVASSAGEEGAVDIMVMPWATRDNHMTVFEVWQDEAAHHAHLAADHMKNFRVALTPLIGAMYDERVYTGLE